jgi:2-polyprenyl-3-methyl-5-hydroxy-6-metoxy-1,4-benzoquinol methylase
MNCGYALLTENGETIQMTTKNEKHHQFQYQLYHYAALGIKFQETLAGKRVLDLGCGRGGGCK